MWCYMYNTCTVSAFTSVQSPDRLSESEEGLGVESMFYRAVLQVSVPCTKQATTSFTCQLHLLPHVVGWVKKLHVHVLGVWCVVSSMCVVHSGSAQCGVRVSVCV